MCDGESDGNHGDDSRRTGDHSDNECDGDHGDNSESDGDHACDSSEDSVLGHQSDNGDSSAGTGIPYNPPQLQSQFYAYGS